MRIFSSSSGYFSFRLPAAVSTVLTALIPVQEESYVIINFSFMYIYFNRNHNDFATKAVRSIVYMLLQFLPTTIELS